MGGVAWMGFGVKYRAWGVAAAAACQAVQAMALACRVERA